MARRFTHNMNGDRFLANKSPRMKEVHDLDNEKSGEEECMIDEIIAAGHDVPFNSLPAAKYAGFSFCKHCIVGSTK